MLSEVMNQSKLDRYAKEHVWEVKEVKEVTVKISMFLLLSQYYRHEILISFQIHWSDEVHFHQNSRHTEWVIRNRQERNCSDCTQKRRRTADTQFSIWAMIEVDYKSELMFYEYTEEKNYQQKNEKIRKKTYKMSESMTQERYVNEILPIVKARKKEVKSAEDQFMFQKNNDDSHDTRSEENIARFRKMQMKLKFIENWSSNSSDLNSIENVWRILKSRVKRYKCTTSKQLRKVIEQKWKKITLKKINECILNSSKGKKNAREVKKDKSNWHDRMQQCWKRNEYSTQF